MSIKESIIFHAAMKLLEKIDFAITQLRCKKSLADKTLILFLILISYLKNIENFNNTSKCFPKMNLRKMFGLLNQQILVEVEEFI